MVIDRFLRSEVQKIAVARGWLPTVGVGLWVVFGATYHIVSGGDLDLNIIAWYPKQAISNGCLVKHPFSM